MAVAGQAVREAIGLPIGFNVLRNDGRSGLALCASCGGSFIRVNVLTGAMLTDQGLIEGDAYTIMRVRRQLCPDVAVLADVHVKHAVPLANWPLEQAARDTLERGLADGLIVSGTGTGLATDPADVATVRRACPQARILVGSGTTLENVAGLLPYVDGVIVGTSLKRSGRVEEAVDSARVAALAKTLR
jgi:membrane complex biogenesis BtpA family protein